VYALCVGCFNLYVEAHRDPPASPFYAQQDRESGVAFLADGKVHVQPAR
jgi:hypothetical protein